MIQFLINRHLPLPCPLTEFETSDSWNAGVSSFDVSLEKQEVIVKGTVPYEDVLAKIKKTGKEVRDYPSTSPRPISLTDSELCAPTQVRSGTTVE